MKAISLIPALVQSLLTLIVVAAALLLYDRTVVRPALRIVLGGGVMQHARLFAPIRERTQHWLGGYIARDEVETNIDRYIVPPGLGDRSGILGALRLATLAVEP